MNKFITKLAAIVVFCILTVPVYAQEESTTSGDSIREKVRQKIEDARSKPKAYIGIVTDKTETGIQLEGNEGEIQQLSINDDASFIKINKTSQKITLDDIAIGDFVIAMGYPNVNDILETKRLLQTDPLENPNRKIIFGVVKGIENKTLSILTRDGEIEAIFPKRWKGPEINEIEKDNKVILVVVIDEETLTIRTIEILEIPTSSPKSEEN